MKAILWSKYNCTNCDQAHALLRSKGYQIEERKIGDGYSKEELFEEVPNARSVPQIFIEGAHVGGFKELQEYLK